MKICDKCKERIYPGDNHVEVTFARKGLYIHRKTYLITKDPEEKKIDICEKCYSKLRLFLNCDELDYMEWRG